MAICAVLPQLKEPSCRFVELVRNRVQTVLHRLIWHDGAVEGMDAFVPDRHKLIQTAMKLAVDSFCDEHEDSAKAAALYILHQQTQIGIWNPEYVS